MKHVTDLMYRNFPPKADPPTADNLVAGVVDLGPASPRPATVVGCRRPNLRTFDLCLYRMAHGMLARRAQTGAVFSQVVEVGARYDLRGGPRVY